MTNSAHARVLVMTPDLNTPIGGVKIHYQVVDVLNEAGIEALVVHRKPGFRCTWFHNDTPIVDVASLRVNRHDVLVVPEEWVGFVPNLPRDIPKVIFHQNAYSTFSWGVDATVIRDVLDRPDVRRVVVVSNDNGAYLQYAFPGIDVRRMRYTIDQSVFGARAANEKKRQIAYMPRRRFQESNDVLSLLRSRGALDGWQVVAVDGMNEAQVAACLQDSAIFLSFSQREGLPLPPAEAMSCGCVVIGFHGFGGRDFGDNAIWVPDGDVVEFARTVESVTSSWDDDAARFESIAGRASAHIRDTYTASNTTSDVVSAFGLPLDGVAAGGSYPVDDAMWEARSLGQRILDRTKVTARVLLKG